MLTTDIHPDLADVTVAHVALNFPQAVDVLGKYDIDYCCHGQEPFVEACESAGLDVCQLWQEIIQATARQGKDGRMRFDAWKPSLLIDFIVEHHHAYVREAIPHIQELLDKVCNVHGEDTPAVLAVRDDFNDLAEELLNHMPKEEEVLFPAIRRLLDPRSPASMFSSLADDIQAPIEIMEHEHEHAGQLIRSLRNHTQHYTAPEHGCATFHLVYKMLQEFDNDLMQHIHIENNILFARVKE